MKTLIALTLVGFSYSAHAARIVCQYQQQPCDQFGNHYSCTYVGWVGPGILGQCYANDPVGVGQHHSPALPPAPAPTPTLTCDPTQENCGA